METTPTATTTELIETGEKHDMLGRRLTPEERRTELLALFRASGLTQAAFARREGLTYSTFCTWVQVERMAGRLPIAKPGGVRTKSTAKTSSVRFVEASLPEQLRESGHRLEVRLPDGTELRGSSAVDLAKLLRLLRG